MYIECGERPVPVVKFEIVAEGSGYFSSEAASWSGMCQQFPTPAICRLQNKRPEDIKCIIVASKSSTKNT